MFVKCLGDLWCLLNVNPASVEAELISFLLEEIVEPCLLKLEGSARVLRRALCVEEENDFHIVSIAPSIQASTC